MPERASGGGESGATTGPTASQNLSPCLGGHACAKAVSTLTFDIRRLECLLHLNLIKSTLFFGVMPINLKSAPRCIILLPSFLGKKGRKTISNAPTVKHRDTQKQVVKRFLGPKL